MQCSSTSKCQLDNKKVTRIFSTWVKWSKTDVLTWYLQCIVGILIQGAEAQKDATLVFHQQQCGGLEQVTPTRERQSN